MINTTHYGWPHPQQGDHTRTWEYWDVYENIDASLKAVDNARIGNETWQAFAATANQAIAAGGSVYLNFQDVAHAGTDWAIQTDTSRLRATRIGTYELSGRMRGLHDVTKQGYFQVYLEGTFPSPKLDWLETNGGASGFIDVNIHTVPVWITNVTQELRIRVAAVTLTGASALGGVSNFYLRRVGGLPAGVSPSMIEG